MPDSIDLEVWEKKLLGKKIVATGGQVSDPEREVSEEDVSSGVNKYRILKPNSMMTMDYWEDRLNVHVNGDEMIVERLSIG